LKTVVFFYFKFPQIKISSEKIDASVIGKLYLDKKVKEIDVFDLMKNGNKQIFDLNFHPIDIVGLPDNQIVCVSNEDPCIVVYDQNFNLLKNVKSLNDQHLDPIGIALNKEDEQLYIVENANNRIILTDLDFNFIKYFGSQGKGNHEFDNPSDICFKNHSIYVCDNHNNRVQIFNKDFEFISTLKTNYGPWKIKVSNLLICVQCFMDEIHFYNLNDLSLHRKYSGATCGISICNSCFYEFDVKENIKINFYDKNGDLKGELIINNFAQFFTNGYLWDGTFIDYKGDLLILSMGEKKIIRISKN
jgi:hypothetical protein